MKFREYIIKHKMCNVHLSLISSLDSVVDFFVKFLSDEFKDVIIVDTLKKPHHIGPEKIEKFITNPANKNNLIIYKHVDDFKLQKPPNNNYILILTHGYEISLPDVKNTKLSINDLELAISINVHHNQKHIELKENDNELFKLINKHSHLKNTAIHLINNQNTKKLLFGPKEHTQPLKKMMKQLNYSSPFFNTSNTTVDDVNKKEMYTLYSHTKLNVYPEDIDELHYMSHYDIDYFKKLIKCSTYTKSYPRHIHVHIYNNDKEDIQKFVVQLDKFKNKNKDKKEYDIIKLIGAELHIKLI